MKTTFFRPETVTRRWILIDATDQSVGRLAVIIANILRGKDRPEFTPNAMVGDNVIVINASKLAIDPKKGTQTCLLYTSDAADDLLCVDLGGRRIIKKKKKIIK